MSYEAYNALRGVNSSQSDYWRKHTQSLSSKEFSNSTNYFLIGEENLTVLGTYDSIGVRINQVTNPLTGNNISDDWKRLTFANTDYQTHLGRKYLIDSEVFLTVNKSAKQRTFTKTTVRKCNVELNWYNDKRELVTEDCVVDYYAPSVGSNVYKDKLTVSADGFRYVWMQYNDNTSKLIRDSRLVFDSRAWRVAEYDSVTHSGLMILTVEEHNVNLVNDEPSTNTTDKNNQPLYQNPDIEQLIGSDNIISGGFSESYSINNSFGDSYTFAVIDGSENVELSNIASNSVTITSNDFNNSEITLQATNSRTLATFNKIIDIVNGW